MRIFAFVSMLGLAAGSFAPLHAQSLADVAKKEGERRQTTKNSTKVYTNGDLKPVGDPAPDVAAAPADASSSADKKSADLKSDAKADSAKGDGKAADKSAARDAKASGDGEEKNQEYWGTKMRALNEKLERDRMYAEAIQTRINSLTADFSAKDDPAQRAMIADDREKAVSELSRLRKQIEEDKDDIGNLEEEARHANVPPGWLR
ncbi:MAG TPA: hypothetical protein VF456_06255 [Vicinamibacterales bacterium]